MSLERRTESLDGSFGRFVFDEELSVEESGIDIADVLCL